MVLALRGEYEDAVVALPAGDHGAEGGEVKEIGKKGAVEVPHASAGCEGHPRAIFRTLVHFLLELSSHLPLECLTCPVHRTTKESMGSANPAARIFCD